MHTWHFKPISSIDFGDVASRESRLSRSSISATVYSFKAVMDDEILTDPEIRSILATLAQESYDLEPLVDDLTASFQNLYPAPHCALQLPRISAKYTQAIARIDSLILQSDRALSLLESPQSASAPSARGPIPIPSITAQDYFFTRQLPLVGLPYPPLCGNIPADPSRPLDVGAFVAALIGEDYSLCHIVAVDGNRLLLSDVDPSNPTQFESTADQVLPLPTSLPNRLTETTEFPPQSTVLALWPEDDSWTTAFYRATVLKPPSENRSCYRLRFELITKPMDVPPGYVIGYPVH
jgi:SAGA-associated factor 29